jgi:hypothetical protein
MAVEDHLHICRRHSLIDLSFQISWGDCTSLWIVDVLHWEDTVVLGSQVSNVQVL